MNIDGVLYFTEMPSVGNDNSPLQLTTKFIHNSAE